MAKPKNSSAQHSPQLSLFDFFEVQHSNPVIDNHKTENDDAINNTEGQYGNGLQYPADGRSENENGISELRSPIPLGHSQRPATTALSTDAPAKDTHTNAEHSSEQVQRGNVQPDDVTGDTGNSSERTGVEQLRGNAQPVANFSITYDDFIAGKNDYKLFSKKRL